MCDAIFLLFGVVCVCPDVFGTWGGFGFVWAVQPPRPHTKAHRAIPPLTKLPPNTKKTIKGVRRGAAALHARGDARVLAAPERDHAAGAQRARAVPADGDDLRGPGGPAEGKF